MTSMNWERMASNIPMSLFNLLYMRRVGFRCQAAPYYTPEHHIRFKHLPGTNPRAEYCTNKSKVQSPRSKVKKLAFNFGLWTLDLGLFRPPESVEQERCQPA